MHKRTDKLKGKQILIAEDDYFNLFSLKKIIENKCGVNADSAKTGKEVIAKIGEKKYDLLLLDIRMPEMDGFEVLNEMKNTNKLQAIPTIAVTANAMLGDKEKCLRAGAYDYISKPININGLVKKMVKVLK